MIEEYALTFGNSLDNAQPDEWDGEEPTEAERAALLEAAYGPLPANPGAVDWDRDDARDFRDAWDTMIPLAEYDGVPW